MRVALFVQHVLICALMAYTCCAVCAVRSHVHVGQRTLIALFVRCVLVCALTVQVRVVLDHIANQVRILVDTYRIGRGLRTS